MSVDIQPLPAWARKTRYKPLPPPVIVGEPTRADVELALALFAELDPQSQAWYGGIGFESRLRSRIDEVGSKA